MKKPSTEKDREMSKRFHWSEFALWAIALGAMCVASASAFAQGTKPDGAVIERGRYIARIAGCNDCHTTGYAMSGGKVPEQEWLKGDALGWRGPWGTTYPANLRLVLSRMSEAEWIKFARTTELRPPMPWFALRDMSESDLRALYHFVRSLGPVGKPAPAYVPPGQTPKGPFVQFPAPPQ
jgi:mono/diheme cytochrome c family protein